VQKWAFKVKSTLASPAILGFKSLVHYMLIGVKRFCLLFTKPVRFLKNAIAAI